MKEKTLLKIALICGLLGVLVLFAVSDNLVISEKSIDRINMDNLEEDVKITGNVKKITEMENVIIIEIEQPNSVPIFLFKDKSIQLKLGDQIEVIGEIEEYEGELEIIAERIRIID